MIALKLTDTLTQTSKTYSLKSFGYGLTCPRTSDLGGENEYIDDGHCGLNLVFSENLDEFMLKWIAGETKYLSGTITTAATDASNKTSILSFTDGRVAGSTGTFYNTGLDDSTQINIELKTLSVDNVIIFKSTEK